MNTRTTALLITLMLILGCGEVTAPEKHLIPDSYQGDVFIVSGVPNGEPPHRELFTIVFNIPANGILFTQDYPSPGWHSSKYYEVDSSGNRRRLELEPSSVHRTPANLADERRFVWFPRSVTWGSISYTQYYVGSRADLLSRKPDKDELRFRAYLEGIGFRP